MYLSPSQLRCECAPQIVPGHTGFNGLAKWNLCEITGFAETTSERASAHSSVTKIKYSSGGSIQDDSA